MTGPNDHDEGQPAIIMNLFGRQLTLLLGAIGGRGWIASAHGQEQYYFALNSFRNSLDFMKLPISFELASRMIILTVLTPAASEHRVAHPAGSTQLAMHPAVQLIVQVG
jgi:hypothetical protein